VERSRLHDLRPQNLKPDKFTVAATRVTVTLPEELLVEMDQQAENRSLFVAEAVRAELHRRRKERLIHCLQQPHPESVEMAECGFQEWVAMAAERDSELVDPTRLRPVHSKPWRRRVPSRAGHFWLFRTNSTTRI